MTLSLQEFQARLIARAKTLGWDATDAAMLVSDRFKGRERSEGGALPEERLGARLGSYPVIVTPMAFTDEDGVRAQVRAVHSQVLIARSYLPAASIVDVHVFLLAHADMLKPNQVLQLNRVERDESICRKLVCVIQEDVESSFAQFLDRTFLARPWEAAKPPRNRHFQLDQPASLVRQILMKEGLTREAADQWVQLADDYMASNDRDPAQLVERLAKAAEPDHE